MKSASMQSKKLFGANSLLHNLNQHTHITMKLLEAISRADSIFTNIWMEAGKSGHGIIISKVDAMKACVDFLNHEFDENDDAIYNKEGRAVAYINYDERSADSSFTLEIGSC